MRRVSVADIMRETGLSRATVDRVLNRRGSVHPRTRAVVEETLGRLSSPGGEVALTPVADIAMRVGKGMMTQMRQAWAAADVRGIFEDLHLASEEAVLRRVEGLCRDVTRPLILTAKNSDRLTAVLRQARGRGKRIIAMVSDLAPAARDGFVGIDDRAAGQTAAFLIGRMLGDRPTTVGVVLGNSAFRCHEDREIGFRTGLRANFPKVVLAAEAQGEDSAELTREAVARMLRAQPALAAIYNVGGGNVGLVEALRQAGRAGDVLIVGHEANNVTLPLLRDGGMDFVIASPQKVLLDEALRRATSPAEAPQPDQTLVDFGVYTRFNLPSFSGAA
jgi:LacI family transcriptional regulator